VALPRPACQRRGWAEPVATGSANSASQPTHGQDRPDAKSRCCGSAYSVWERPPSPA